MEMRTSFDHLQHDISLIENWVNCNHLTLNSMTKCKYIWLFLEAILASNSNSWRLRLRKGGMFQISRSTVFDQPIIFQAYTIDVHEGE